MVYLIGAGPGDPGLITYKGLQILKSCDAVIYDRLGTGELLDLVRPDCAKIYVGKQAGAHYKKQEEINRILVETAGKYENVVRLKGGDSFVFGRGGEEILTLQESDIPFQVIPGVTSAIAVPAYNGIPVTHRDFCSSVHIITGHKKKMICINDSNHEIDFEKAKKEINNALDQILPEKSEFERKL